VARSSLQDVYVGLLLDRVRDEKFPNPEHLDRIEASLSTPQQLRKYIELLLEKVADMRRPSPAILDRLQRFAALERTTRQKSRSS